ncbi:MAG: hypothetical protein M3Q07_10770, partial [Pseudobdellovibrionaceae bacterium]|nr:hypothetical protein [Pseudobdellovibrionaceae bacterium]
MPYPLSGTMLIILCSELCIAGFERPSPPVDNAVQSAWENHLLPTLEDGFDEIGYSILAVGVVSTVIANNQDAWIRREWRGEQKVSRDVTEFGAVWGSGGPSLVMAGALLYYDRPSGAAFTEGVAMTSVTHFAISRLAGRRRPGNPLIRTSFPSGHTANAWSMA